MTTSYLGLGSNLGNRLAFLRGGRDALISHPGILLLNASAIYETAPVGGPPDNPAFLNAVLAIETTLSPRELLEVCLAVETEFGRTRPMEWAPRTLDIDLLLYGELMLSEADLEIPHPRLHERAFVLAPLNELAPQVRHPRFDRTVGELFAALPTDGAVVRTSWELS